MLRNSLRNVTKTAQRVSRRHASSASAPRSGDTKWLVSAVVITVPTLGYLLSPPSKKADVHKAVHKSAAQVGLTDKTPEEAVADIPDEIHGPDSRADAKSEGRSQDPKAMAAQALAHADGKPTSGRDKPGREDSATASGAAGGSGKMENKQSGLSNTETKSKVNYNLKGANRGSPAKTLGTVDERTDEQKEASAESGKSHATGESMVPESIQKLAPHSLEKALPESIHPTEGSNPAKSSSSSSGESHATGKSAVPESIQKAAPESLEKALPESVHPTDGKPSSSSGFVSHATGESLVPATIQKYAPEWLERALPEAVHPTNPPTAKSDSMSKSHATGKSIVPEIIQKYAPESVEKALPESIHPTNPVSDSTPIEDKAKGAAKEVKGVAKDAKASANKAVDDVKSKASSSLGKAKDAVHDAAHAFTAEGSIGSKFTSSGEIGGKVDEKVGGPFSKDGKIGKQFEKDGAVGSLGQSVAEKAKEKTE